MTQPSIHPLCESAEHDRSDGLLAAAAADGDRGALCELLGRHQRWVYAIALRMVREPSDAADISQEALLRMVTRISRFEGRSSFRTWAYRIVSRCFLDMKRTRSEGVFSDFETYGAELDRLPLTDLNLDAPLEPDRHLIVEEAKIGCVLGMLLCLDREQRLAYILGGVFEVPSDVAADVMEIEPAAFRKRLERARADLGNFMAGKCGLVNAANPCRCPRKTSALIREGWVDPRKLRFVDRKLRVVSNGARELSKEFDGLVSSAHDELVRSLPTSNWPDLTEGIVRLFDSGKLLGSAL